ncbi:hypothetical protein WJX81_008102 [Elliptochloris bilobata]|uniref:Uncharacterized protein n=1 Tax=Elliptochloris bilobata TaxID=381761 RepID=A0AAW1RV77_9CHLO
MTAVGSRHCSCLLAEKSVAATARPFCPANPPAVRCSARHGAPYTLRPAVPCTVKRQLARRLYVSAQASSNGASSTSPSAEYVEEGGFRIEQISFGAILTPLGVSLLTYGFGSFFQLLPGSDIAAILLIYGFPITLLGFALSYAQLRPVPCKSTREAIALRETQATDIQKQLREDVTRFRYGDEQHLDDTLTRLFQFNRPKGVPRRLTPVLTAVREEAVGGQYTLVLEFQVKPAMTTEMWTDRLERIQNFFGPGIRAKVKRSEGEGEGGGDAKVELSLITDGSGAGRGGDKQADALPPLMPGLPARRGGSQ